MAQVVVGIDDMNVAIVEVMDALVILVAEEVLE